MKVYAIYQKGLGKIAREYIDTRDGLIAGRYMYIPENTLPVVIGRFGDYCTFVDEAEMLTSDKCWPVPGYGKLLFSVY